MFIPHQCPNEEISHELNELNELNSLNSFNSWLMNGFMNFRDIRVLYCREIRSALRDRTIVTNSILLPIFLYPLIMWLAYTGFTFISGQNEELKSRVMIQNVPAAHANLLKELETDKSIVLVQIGGSGGRHSHRDPGCSG